MTNFYYSGNLRENERFVIRHYHSYGRDYEKAGNTDCDFCHDIYDRREMDYVVPAFDNNEDPDKIAWTVKLCGSCLNVLIADHEMRNCKRLGICKEQVDDWEQITNNQQEERKGK